MSARIGPNQSKLRASVRSATVPPSDQAAVQLAERLAWLLDVAGSDAVGAEDEIPVYRTLGPLYLRTLTALGLTRDGRGVGDTAGSAGGVSADVARRDELRARRDVRGA